MINKMYVAQALKLQAKTATDALSVTLIGGDKGYQPTPTQTLVIESPLFGDDEAIGVGDDSSDLQTGIYQLDVLTPKVNGNKWQALNLATQINQYFTRGTELTKSGQKVRIKNTNTSSLIQDDTHFRYALSITFTVIN